MKKRFVLDVLSDLNFNLINVSYKERDKIVDNLILKELALIVVKDFIWMKEYV